MTYFSDDTLAYKDYKDILAHKVIMSATNMSRSNSQFLGATVHELMQILALNGDAILNLTTSGHIIIEKICSRKNTIDAGSFCTGIH